MLNKDFANSFAEKMKETANKENEYKERILHVLVEIANTLNDQNELIDEMNQMLRKFDNYTDSGDIFNRLVVKNIVIGEE